MGGCSNAAVDLIGRLAEINDQLNAVRLEISDPLAQGYLFTAQSQIATYLTIVKFYDEKVNS
jgi:hypothetical protein